MATVLVIDEKAQAAIKAAIERARLCPISAAEIKRLAIPDKFHVTLADRAGKRITSSQHVELQNGYRLSIGFEEQPMGLCIHISISMNGRPPNPWAAEMIAKECGIPFSLQSERPSPDIMTWIEDFIEGDEVGHAVNMVYRLPTTNGH
jgi:hypothetical protein